MRYRHVYSRIYAILVYHCHYVIQMFGFIVYKVLFILHIENICIIYTSLYRYMELKLGYNFHFLLYIYIYEYVCIVYICVYSLYTYFPYIHVCIYIHTV